MHLLSLSDMMFLVVYVPAAPVAEALPSVEEHPDKP